MRVFMMVVSGALALLAVGCPASPTARDDLRVSCVRDADCDDLSSSYARPFTCDLELGLCTGAPGRSDGGPGDGGGLCAIACPPEEICLGGQCVSELPTLRIVSPDPDTLVGDTVSVVAQITAPLGVKSLRCDESGGGFMVLSPPPAGPDVSCDLSFTGADGVRTVTVTLVDQGDHTVSAQVDVLRDTAPPELSVFLRQSPGGALGSDSQVWPTGVASHGDLLVEAQIVEANLDGATVSASLEARGGRAPIVITMACTASGPSLHVCTGALVLEVGDFRDLTQRGAQRVSVSAADGLGRVGTASAAFHVDVSPPVIRVAGCTPDHTDSNGVAVRNATLSCSVEASDAETGLSGGIEGTLPQSASNAVRVASASLNTFSVTVDLNGHAFNTFAYRLPNAPLTLSLMATDVWGNGALLAHPLEATRLRWKIDLGGVPGSPAVASDGTIYLAVKKIGGSVDVLGLDPATGSTIWSSSSAFGGDEVVAGPVIQEGGSTVLHLLTAAGGLWSYDLNTSSGWNPLLVATLPQQQISFRTLPVVSADGTYAYVAFERLDRSTNTTTSAFYALDTSMGTGCPVIESPGKLDAASVAAWKDLTTGLLILHAADQTGHAYTGACDGCSCATSADTQAPVRFGGLAAFRGGFLYPDGSSNIASSDEVLWGSLTPLSPSSNPTWTSGRLAEPRLTAGPLHDNTWVYAGARAAFGPELVATELASPFGKRSTDLGSFTVYDLLLGENDIQWITRTPTLGGKIELVATSAGTSSERWVSPSFGLRPAFSRPTVDPVTLGYDPLTGDLLLPTRRFLSSVVIDAALAPGWPMGRANPARTGLLP